MLGSATPVLRIFDEAKAREFYLDFLGFQVEFEHRFEPGLPLYLSVIRDGLILHLSEHHGDACPGAQVRIATYDVHGFVNELSARDYGYARPGAPERQPWGTDEITLADPFGNRLTFWQPVDGN